MLLLNELLETIGLLMNVSNLLFIRDILIRNTTTTLFPFLGYNYLLTPNLFQNGYGTYF